MESSTEQPAVSEILIKMKKFKTNVIKFLKEFKDRQGSPGTSKDIGRAISFETSTLDNATKLEKLLSDKEKELADELAQVRELLVRARSVLDVYKPVYQD